MPDDVARTADPFEVFAYAATISEDLAARVEAEMTDQELAAVPTAAPTPYVHEVVTACQNSGRSVAVVSNNSARTVHAYLTRHGLDDRISLVIARTNHNPALLKPSPHLITQAVDALHAEPGECALVGDSVTDVKAAQLARVQSIGYASEPGMRERLTEAGAGAIINSLADLALRLRARVADPELLQLPSLSQGAHLRRAGPDGPDREQRGRGASSRGERAARVARRRRPGFTRGLAVAGRQLSPRPSDASPFGAATAALGSPVTGRLRSPSYPAAAPANTTARPTTTRQVH